MSVLEAVRIRLATHKECVHADGCEAFADQLHEQLASGRYDWPVSVLEIDDFDAYLAEHRTARKRAARCERRGYRFAEIERADHQGDIYRINTSMPERQGRPMSVGYKERPEFSPLPEYPCPRHRICTYGVLNDTGLVAYLVLYLSGDLAMVSQILGHADHHENEVMYLLVVEALRRTPKPVTVFYNRHDSGTDGLRFFKERLGFRPERVAWAA